MRQHNPTSLLCNILQDAPCNTTLYRFSSPLHLVLCTQGVRATLRNMVHLCISDARSAVMLQRTVSLSPMHTPYTALLTYGVKVSRNEMVKSQGLCTEGDLRCNTRFTLNGSAPSYRVKRVQVHLANEMPTPGFFANGMSWGNLLLFFSQIKTRRCGEMVDTWLSKSHGEICVGSSPTSGTSEI